MGAGSWEDTPFNAWTNEALQELLQNSPWAGEATISRVRPSTGGPPAATPIAEKAIVTWTTALPIRQALVRESIGVNGTVTKDAEAFLSAPAITYVVAVRISGGTASASYASLAEEIRKEAFLVRTDGRSPLLAQSVEARALDKTGKLLPADASAQDVEGGESVFVFQFSKGLALTMLDREVEFVTRVGTLNIKKKFKMKDMVYKGELAL